MAGIIDSYSLMHAQIRGQLEQKNLVWARRPIINCLHASKDIIITTGIVYSV